MDELFKNIDEANKIKLLQELETITKKKKKNKTILSSVKNDNIICIVVKGHIQIVKNDFNGNRIIIEDLKQGSIFGSISANIFNNEYEIVTKEDSNIVIIELDYIIRYNKENEYYRIFIKNLLKILYDKTVELNNHIEILSNKTIRDKLLAYFKIMTKNSNSKIIYLPFSYSYLADYLAINRSAMAREMKVLKEEGLIETKGKKIKLLYYI